MKYHLILRIALGIWLITTPATGFSYNSKTQYNSEETLMEFRYQPGNPLNNNIIDTAVTPETGVSDIPRHKEEYERRKRRDAATNEQEYFFFYPLYFDE